MKKATDSLAMLLKTRPFAVFSTLICIFAFLRLTFPVEPLLFVALFLGLFLVFLYASDRIDAFIAILIFSAIILGCVVTNVKIKNNEQLTSVLDGQFVRIEGTVVTIPKQNKTRTTFYLESDTIYSHKGQFDDKIKFYAQCDNLFNVKYGDRIVMNATIHGIDSENTYFGKHYLSKGAVFTAKKTMIIQKNEAHGIKQILYTTRNYVSNLGNRFFHGDARELFKALTAGDRSGFSDTLTTNLSRSGLSHIACVSGLHVSILGMAVYNLIKRKNRYLSAFLSVLVVYLFAFLTGATPSTLRAAIMFTSYIAAETALMDNDSFTSLSFSAAVLMLVNPYVIFDWGAILSFLSVFGIQMFSYRLKRCLAFLPEEIAESMGVTLSAFIMTMPATVNMFGYISVYSIFANIFISIVFVYVLYACFIFLLVSFIPVVNYFCATVCGFMLECVAVVANMFADLPMSIALVDKFDVIEYIVYYTVVFIFIFKDKLSVKVISAVMILLIAMLLIGAFLPV